MSQENIRRYQRGGASENPFSKSKKTHKSQKTDQGLPGSVWGLSQVEWLGVVYEWDCEFNQILSQASEFQPNSQLQRSVDEGLNLSWEEIINNKDLGRQSFYAQLAQLARIQKPLDDYDKSSTIEGSSPQPASQDREHISPSSSSSQRIQEPNTPIQRFRSSPPSTPPSFTSRLKRPLFTTQNPNPQPPFSSPLSSPPTVIKPPTTFSQRQSLNSESPSQRKLQSKKKSDPQQNVGSQEAFDEDTQATEKQTLYSLPPSLSTTDSRKTRRLNEHSMRRVSDNSSSDDGPSPKRRSSLEDDDFHPSSPQAPVEVTSSEARNSAKTQLLAEHKPEEEVQLTARPFLKELMGFFDKTCQNRRGRWDIDLDDA